MLDSFTSFPFGEDDGAFSKVPGESGPGGADSVEASLHCVRLLVECLQRAKDALLVGRRRQRYLKVAECCGAK